MQSQAMEILVYVDHPGNDLIECLTARLFSPAMHLRTTEGNLMLFRPAPFGATHRAESLIELCCESCHFCFRTTDGMRSGDMALTKSINIISCVRGQHSRSPFCSD